MRGNKGEWSEIYVLLKLLHDKLMYAGDENLNTIQDIFYPILSIKRDSNVIYNIEGENNISLIKRDGTTLHINSSNFPEIISDLFNNISTSNETTFEIPSLTNILDTLCISRLSASSHDKQDIYIKFHDIRTRLINESGFSIKSMLGSSSTLLNASGSTKFIFKIDLNNISLEATRNLRPGKEVVTFLLNNGCSLNFDKTSNNIFTSNLMMTDYVMPQLLANIILIYFSSRNSTLTSILEIIENDNFLNIPANYLPVFYKYKIKQLLVNIALGMMPATIWNGNFTANGGYIIVKETGDIICYHIYDKNRFENYLFNNIKLDTPSLSRHNCGKIYGNNGNHYIDLPLQLRFIR